MPRTRLIEEVLSTSFAEKKHNTPSFYLESHAYHILRSTLPPSPFGDPAQELAGADLSRFVNTTKGLGPYEKHVLANLLLAQKKLIVIVGSAGSGKSSTIRRVLAHYDEHSISTESSATRRRLYAVVDFNGERGHFDDLDRRATGPKDRFAIEDAAVSRLCEYIAGWVPVFWSRGEHGDRAAQLLDVVEQAWAYANSVRTDEPFSFDADLGRVLNTHALREARDSSKDYRRLLSAIEGVPAPSDRLRFWFGVLEYIHQLPSDSEQAPHATLFIVIDNIDPLPEYVQQRIKKDFLDLAQRMTFKVIFPARLSTFRQGNYYGVTFCWYPHSGPAPIDVLRLRILAFLRDPDRVESYRALPSEGARRLERLRLAELILRLYRGRGPEGSLYRILSCSAGDSVRRLVEYARSLFLNKGLAEQYDITLDEDELDDALRDLASEFAARAMWCDVASIIREVLSDRIATLVDCFKMNSAAVWSDTETTALARRVLTSTHAVVERYTEVLGREFLDITPSQWSHICESEGAKQFGDEISDVHGLVEHARYELDCDIDLTSVGDALANLLTESDLPLNADVRRVWASHVRSALSSPSAASSTSAFRAHFDDWNKGALAQSLVDDRDQPPAARTLVRNGQYVVDLFHLSTFEVRAVKLRVLALLASRRHGRATLGAVVERMADLGYRPNELLEALDTLSQTRNRLIWLDKGFGFESWQEIEAWCKDRHCVLTLTRSGWEYVVALTGEPDYVVDRFVVGATRTGGPVATVVDRLRCSLMGLEAVHEEDMSCVARRRKACSDQHWRGRERLIAYAENALGIEVAARCTEGVVRIASSHFENLRRHQGDPASRRAMVATRQLVHDWGKMILRSRASWCEQVDEINLRGHHHRVFWSRSVAPWRLVRSSKCCRVVSIEHALSEIGLALAGEALNAEFFPYVDELTESFQFRGAEETPMV